MFIIVVLLRVVVRSQLEGGGGVWCHVFSHCPVHGCSSCHRDHNAFLFFLRFLRPARVSQSINISILKLQHMIYWSVRLLCRSCLDSCAGPKCDGGGRWTCPVVAWLRAVFFMLNYKQVLYQVYDTLCTFNDTRINL